MLKFYYPILFVFAILCMSWTECEPTYHTVPAETGDTIMKLLSRYGLADHTCNYTQFYKLNDLTKESQLIADKEYHIPALIYHFDGKTIRSTVEIESWEKAIRIKKYNEKLLEDKLRKSTIIDSKILWVPHHELYCDDKLLSDEEARQLTPLEKTSNIEKGKSGRRNFPIFGPDFAYVPLTDNSLAGKVFYIVSGHGGPDPGAIGKVGKKTISEDEYAYDVSLRLCRNLIARGAVAYMITRDPNDGIRTSKFLANDTDEYCWGNFKIPRSQKRRLFQRSDAINDRFAVHEKQGVGEQIMLSIHIDSRSKGQKTDVFFYFYPGSKKGQQLAHTLQQTLKAKYKKFNAKRKYTGTVTGRDLHMLRETLSTGAYIELGNIRNPNDQKRFLIESNRQALADWLYDGLVGYVKK